MLLATVQSIMTTKMYTWNPEEQSQDDIVKFAEDKEYDTVPVVHSGKIDGLLYVAERDVKPLTRDLMLTHDTPTSAALQLLNHSVHPAFLVLQQQEIKGILTPSDFNKVTARSYFYSILAVLEMKLANHIRAYYQDENNIDEHRIVELIKPEDKTISQYKKKIRKRTSASVRNQYRLDLIHNLMFSEIIKLIKNDNDFCKYLGFDDHTLFSGINGFRNKVMHSTRVLLKDSFGIDELTMNVQFVLKITEIIEGNADD